MTSAALMYSPQVNEIPSQRKGVTGPSSTTNISSFYLGKLLYLEKMTSEFKKQGPAQTKCHKRYIIRWALQMLLVKILTKN